MGVGGNDVPKNSPLTLMKYKCFLAGYQKPAKLVKYIYKLEEFGILPIIFEEVQVT
jgi:hypothetical protein